MDIVLFTAWQYSDRISSAGNSPNIFSNPNFQRSENKTQKLSVVKVTGERHKHTPHLVENKSSPSVKINEKFIHVEVCRY